MRYWNVVRLHLATRSTYLWVPLIVVGATYVLSLMMYGVLRMGLEEDAPQELFGLGGLQFVPFYYCITVGIQAMMYTYPFAMAMSVTRREYVMGTFLLALIFTGALALMYGLGRAIEYATGGLGIGFIYFGLLEWFWNAPLWHEMLFVCGLAAMLFMAGFSAAAVFKRGGVIRVVVVLITWALVIVALLALVTWQEWWPPIGRAVLRAQPAQVGGLMIAAAVSLGAGSYWSARKAVP
jgi:hypothetical protein